MICPCCQAWLTGAFDDAALFLEIQDPHGKPLAPRTLVQPNLAEPAHDDCRWLQTLCQVAGQHRVEARINALYGIGICPACGTMLVPAAEAGT